MNALTKQHKRINTPFRVKIGMSRQIAIPKKIYDALQLNAGDYFEIQIKQDMLVLTPQEFIEKRLAEGLRDIRAGREIGPFTNMDDAINALDT